MVKQKESNPNKKSRNDERCNCKKGNIFNGKLPEHVEEAEEVLNQILNESNEESPDKQIKRDAR